MSKSCPTQSVSLDQETVKIPLKVETITVYSFDAPGLGCLAMGYASGVCFPQ